MDQQSIGRFQESVWDYYARHGRSMPWRADPSPYRVLVSELMLQQTQVDRVRPKFEEFIAAFPDVQALADANLADVLVRWQGLGYNRRARFLHDAARAIAYDYGGSFPDTPEGLRALPGVGKNTAGAILAYAFDRPAVFIETNIRTVLFTHFFAPDAVVGDAELVPILEAVLPRESPREWYWALMDYGSHLKRQGQGRIDQSRQYKKQPPLKGSVREVRGQVIRLLAGAPLPESELRRTLEADERFAPALDGLLRDGLVVRRGDVIVLGAAIDSEPVRDA